MFFIILTACVDDTHLLLVQDQLQLIDVLMFVVS